MAATRADVARAAGVSPSTVTSCSLRSALDALEHPRAVMRAVRELDYHPNTAARSLASPVLRTVGVLFRRQRSTIDANDLGYVDGVRRALEPSGIQVVIPIVKSSAPLIELRSLVRSGALGGVILMDVAQGDEREAMLLKEGIPPSSSAHRDPAVGHWAWILISGRWLVLPWITWPGSGTGASSRSCGETASDDSHARQDQARELLRAAGALAVDVLVRQVPELALAGGDIVGADGLVDGRTAVISNNPAALVGLACAAQAHGLSIPADLSVLTLGVTEYRGRHGEAFSELSVDREAMGEAVGSLLLTRLRGEPAPVEHRTLMPAVLTDHGSTARCRD